MYNPKTKFGVFHNIKIFDNEPFSRKCFLFEQHWEAIYDKYNTISRGDNILEKRFKLSPFQRLIYRTKSKTTWQ